MSAPLRKIIMSVFLALAFTSFLASAGVTEALAQELTCTERLTQADEQYKTGRFEEVIELLKTCVENESFTEEEQQRAYRLLSLSYLGKDLATDARGAIRKLLELVPNYQVNLEQDPPQFAEMINEVKQEMLPEPEPEPEPKPVETQTPEPVTPKKKNNTLKWIAIGGGVVLAGVLAAVLLSGDDDEPCTSISVSEQEPNNAPGQAQVLRDCQSITVNGQAQTSDDSNLGVPLDLDGDGVDDSFDDFEDWYRVRITEPGLRISLSGLNSDIDLYLTESSGSSILAQSINSGTQPEAISDLSRPVGTYLIAVSIFDPDPQGPSESQYTLRVDGQLEGSITNLKFEESSDVATVAEQYRLVGHPGAVDASMNATFAESNLYPWTAFHENGKSLAEYDGSDMFRFQPGRGFWVHSEDALRIDQTIPPVALDHNNAYTIPLHPGWNIIANPFYTTVHWKDVQAANYLTQGLWRWEGRYVMTDAFASAERGEAYYFLNTTNRETLTIPYPGVRSTTTLSERIEGDVLSLTAHRDGRPASTIQVSLTHNASPGFDAYDQFAPPGYFETASLRLVQPAASPSAPMYVLAHEFRPNNGDDQRFDLLLDAPVGEPITLETDKRSAFAGYELYLLDLERSTFYNLNQQPTLTLTPLTEQSRYVLMIGSAGFIETMRDEVAPTTLTLSNAPNPFNPSTQITYTVPASSSGEHVRLEVYNILGQLVQTLVDTSMQPGSYSVTWDGTDASRTPVASGMYFYRLQIGRFHMTKTMQLLK